MKKIISILALTVALSGCAVAGQPYKASSLKPPSKGQSQVVVYWPEWMNGFPVDVNIGDKKCSVLPNSYVVVNVNAGNIDISQGDNPVKINGKSGGRYFVKMSQNKSMSGMQAAGGLIGLFAYKAATNGSDNGAYRFEVMNSDFAQGEVSKTKQALGCK